MIDQLEHKNGSRLIKLNINH